jgi:TetR/AcrR family transcriptional regulator, transcriptional repressor for nem operon
MSEKIKTRDKLLNAGYEEIYKHGYQGASVDAILLASAVTKGSMYHHFPSKKDLALAVIDERIGPKILSLFNLESENEPFTNKMFAIIDFIGTVPYLLNYGCPLSKLITEMSPLDEDFKVRLTAIHEKVHKKVSDMIELAVENRELNITNASSFATFIIATVWGNISLGEDIITPQSYQNSLAHLKSYLLSLS